MADNVVLNPGSGGATVSADEIGGVQYQRVKIGYGKDGEYFGVHTGSPLPIGSFAVEVARGNVNGMVGNRKFGRNPSVGTTEEDIWAGGGVYPWPQAAETLRIAAGGNANDTAAGTGARTVRIEGLDNSMNEITEDLTTAGASASSPTTNTFCRVNRAYVLTSGTYTGTNTGAITIENTSSLNSLANIEAVRGQTQLSMYTVPNGKTAYITALGVEVEGSKSADVYFYQRQGADVLAAPFTAKRILYAATGLSGNYTEQLHAHLVIPGNTDLWWGAAVSSGSTAVAVTYDMFVE